MMNVLSEKNTVFNLQKFRVSDNSELQSSNGKYALIRNSDVNYLCQIFICKNLHPSYCIIDKSVSCYNEAKNYVSYPLKTTLKPLNLSDISVINSVENVKSAVVSVVINSPFNVKKWKSAFGKLCDLVKNILKLFVLKGNSVVYLDGIKSDFESNLECILVETLGNANIGRIVSNSKIKIKQIISKETFLQLHTSCEELPVLGGLDIHLKTLSDLVKLASSVKDHSQPVYKQVPA